MSSTTSVGDILGAWVDSNWKSGLVNRCKEAWNKPIEDLTNEQLATLLRQRIAVDHILPVATKRLREGIDDNSEIYEGELEAAVKYAAKGTKPT